MSCSLVTQHLTSPYFKQFPLPSLHCYRSLQFREATLQIKLTSQTCKSVFKAKLFYLPLPSAYNNLFHWVHPCCSKKIPEGNLKFVFEKNKEDREDSREENEVTFKWDEKVSGNLDSNSSVHGYDIFAEYSSSCLWSHIFHGATIIL